ncbi:MAG: hypothetical protein H0T79_19085 [Deltaproteobacteria bacterium]|nr:hypothetical protein [Deltaproteobacteria bacterium]
MTTRNQTLAASLLLLLGATAAGCAAEVTGGVPPEGDDDVPDGEDQPIPTTLTGKYAMTSEFDLATNMPGTAGQVVNIFVLATDDPDDPTHYIVDKLVDALPDGSIKTNLRNAVPFVSGYLNDRLLDWAPELLTRVVALGNGFGQITKHFGMLETLDIPASGTATKEVTGLHFKVDQTELDFLFADYGMDPIKVEGVAVSLAATGKVTIGEHKMPLSYGKALRLGLDQVIIPMIDPSATNVADLLHGAVNCTAVGQYVYEAVGFGSPSTFASACNSGLTGASGLIYRQIDNLDGAALEFTINGVARGVDKNKDGAMDDLQTGSWAGNLSYAGTPAPLAEGAKFFGKRM